MLLGCLAEPGTAVGQGTIRFVEGPDVLVYGPDAPTSVYFDLNGDGVNDLRFRATGTQFDAIPTGNNAVLANPDPPPNLGGHALRLDSGLEIGPSLQPNWAWMQRERPVPYLDEIGPNFLTCGTIGCNGFWSDAGDTAYLGVRFYAGSELLYGWIRVRTLSIGGTIYDWAYNTAPDQAILAGAVPEPSTWALFSLGLAMILIRRNKRN